MILYEQTVIGVLDVGVFLKVKSVVAKCTHMLYLNYIVSLFFFLLVRW